MSPLTPAVSFSLFIPRLLPITDRYEVWKTDPTESGRNNLEVDLQSRAPPQDTEIIPYNLPTTSFPTPPSPQHLLNKAETLPHNNPFSASALTKPNLRPLQTKPTNTDLHPAQRHRPPCEWTINDDQILAENLPMEESDPHKPYFVNKPTVNPQVEERKKREW